MTVNGWTEEDAKRVYREVLKRSVSDVTFRNLAIRDAAAAIAEIDPKPLPPGYKVRFVDNEGANQTIVLPDIPPANGELSDAELEQVAGGRGNNGCGSTCLGSCELSSML
jgi:hypothetical protein